MGHTLREEMSGMKSILTRLAVLATLAALVALMSSASTVAAAGANISFYPQAQLSPSGQGNGIYVTLTYQCTGGLQAGMIDISANQSTTQSHSGQGASGIGSTTANCDGNSQKVAVFVRNCTGSFNIGSVDVDATLTVASTNYTASRTIKVNHP
jgi:hypothetical protein